MSSKWASMGKVKWLISLRLRMALGAFPAALIDETALTVLVQIFPSWAKRFERRL